MLKKSMIVALASLGVMSAAYASSHHHLSSHHSAKSAIVTTTSSPVNINSASAQNIETLPHVGPKMAGRIVSYRQKNGKFKAVGELTKVKGISVKRLSQWKRLITV